MSKADKNNIAKISDALDSSKSLVIIQADNPDGDSISSALALEDILSEQGKKVHLYCGVDIPSYLRYLPGWDRISKDIPSQFDLSIIVDAGNEILLEHLAGSKQKSSIITKPTLIIDHHHTPIDIAWAKLRYAEEAVSTTALIYDLAKKLGWDMNLVSREFIAIGILSDSLGLTNEATSAHSLRIMAELVEGGVNLAKLENNRRSTMNRSQELVHYKGRLLQRVEYHYDGKIATLSIPWEEIEKYSPEYNPSMLAIDDMRLTTNVAIAICFKNYPDGKVTGKIRCNWGSPIGAKLAERFGGGGHPYAAGFKVNDKPFDELKAEVIKSAAEALEELEKVAE